MLQKLKLNSFEAKTWIIVLYLWVMNDMFFCDGQWLECVSGNTDEYVCMCCEL